MTAKKSPKKSPKAPRLMEFRKYDRNTNREAGITAIVPGDVAEVHSQPYGCDIMVHARDGRLNYSVADSAREVLDRIQGK